MGFPPNHPLKNRVFHYFHHPFRGDSPIFGNIHIPGKTIIAQVSSQARQQLLLLLRSVAPRCFLLGRGEMVGFKKENLKAWLDVYR